MAQPHVWTTGVASGLTTSDGMPGGGALPTCGPPGMHRKVFCAAATCTPGCVPWLRLIFRCSIH